MAFNHILPLADVPFTVQYKNLIGSHSRYHRSPFSKTLDTYYQITPEKSWVALEECSDYEHNGFVYRTGTYACVCHDRQILKESTDKPWAAYILQLRKGQGRCFALVTWMMLPHELQGKESGYHGEGEYIASNYLEILDVFSFSGAIDIQFWNEDPVCMPNSWFWRQTFCKKTYMTSKLPPRCICHCYFNPDISMYMCDNVGCGIWLHASCITALYEGRHAELIDNDEIAGPKLRLADPPEEEFVLCPKCQTRIKGGILASCY